MLVAITEIVCEGKSKKLQLALMYNWNWKALCVPFATFKLTAGFQMIVIWIVVYYVGTGHCPLFLPAGAVGLWVWILHHCCAYNYMHSRDCGFPTNRMLILLD